jgi:hypothetical protein
MVPFEEAGDSPCSMSFESDLSGAPGAKSIDPVLSIRETPYIDKEG